MVTIKRKVTIKTKTAQEETPAAVDSMVTKEKPYEQELEPKHSPATPEHAQKSKTGKIVGGIVAAAVLIGGIYFLGIRNYDSESDSKAMTEQVSQAEEAIKSDALDETNANAEPATTNAETAKPAEADKTPAASEDGNVSTAAKADGNKPDRNSANEAPSARHAKPSLPKQTTATTQEVSATINGDVEENARRVIRGDFGNGQTRKDKLGDSYSEIQGRVNEMYRQGLVH